MSRPSTLEEPAVTTQAASAKSFESAASEARVSLVGELWAFLMENKAWWLAPILIVLALVGALALFGGTGAAPFIYTLF